jgi:FAD/FMN-containing dehydrogenase
VIYPIKELAEAVGREAVLTDEDLLATYATDWNGDRFTGDFVVVRPRTPEQVASVLEVARSEALPVVPQGGNTGLVQGGIPDRPSILMSTRSLRSHCSVKPEDMEVHVDSGVTLDDLADAARRHDLRPGIDLASRQAATVGGIVATNAAGRLLTRFGTTRSQVTGLEVATMTTGMITLMDFPKENAGYDLRSLIVGSEGTLGIVTRARLRLYPIPKSRVVAVVTYESLREAHDSVLELATSLENLEAAEVLNHRAMAVTTDRLGLPSLFSERSNYYVIYEFSSHEKGLEPVERALASVAGGRPDSIIAMDTTRQNEVWRYREEIATASPSSGTVSRFDVGLRRNHMDSLVAELEDFARSTQNSMPLVFGHIADGNLHIHFNGLDAEHEEKIFTFLLSFLESTGGTLSAEHGIGRTRKAWLQRPEMSNRYHLLMGIKRVFDPDGLLNPGVLLSGHPSSMGA